MDSIVIFILVLLGAVLLLLMWIRKKLNYFKTRNVPFLRSVPLLGALGDSVIGKAGIYDVVEKIYFDKQFRDEPFFGIFMFHKPALFIKDPELVKRILIKDFQSFRNHRSGSGDHDPLGIYNLFAAKDAVWTTMRKKLSPFFTTSHLKNVFTVMDKISDRMLAQVDQRLGDNNSLEIELKKLVTLYTVDVIASSAFGVEANSFENPKSEFKWLAEHLFTFTRRRGVELISVFLVPEIMKYLNLKFFSVEGNKFIIESMSYVMREREKSKERRNDLIDILLEIKNSNETTDSGEPISMEMLIAQAGIFFSAGFETSASTTTHALYEMAKNAEIQEQVRREISEALAKNDNKITAEMIMHETPYLTQVVNETMRIYPIIPLIDRECTNPKGYSLEPISDFVIPPGMPVYIPLYGLHRDEKYFEEPLKFDPERFSPENIGRIRSGVFSPFGDGNRVCIGERFGLMQSKLAIVKILRSFRVELTDSTPRNIRLANNAFVIQADVPLIFNLFRDELI